MLSRVNGTNIDNFVKSMRLFQAHGNLTYFHCSSVNIFPEVTVLALQIGSGLRKMKLEVDYLYKFSHELHSFNSI